MNEYKFDRNAFKAMTFNESDAQNRFGKEVPYSERLRQAYLLLSRAYGFSLDNPPKFDRSVFRTRKLNN